MLSLPLGFSKSKKPRCTSSNLQTCLNVNEQTFLDVSHISDESFDNLLNLCSFTKRSSVTKTKRR